MSREVVRATHTLVRAAVLAALSVLCFGGCRGAPGPPPAVASVSIGQRKQRVMRALKSTPVDRELLKRALHDVGHLKIIYRAAQPLEKKPRQLRYPFSHAFVGRRPDGNYYRMYDVYLNRPDGGEIPEHWLKKLAESPPGYPVPVSVEGLGLALPKALRERRNRLVRQAGQRLKAGLLELAGTYPQLTKKSEEGVYKSVYEQDFTSEDGWLWVTVGRKHGGKIRSRKPIPEAESYWAGIRLTPTEWGVIEQTSRYPLYPNLELEGHVSVGAGEERLDAALKRLVKAALEPLQELNDSTRPR